METINIGYGHMALGFLLFDNPYLFSLPLPYRFGKRHAYCRATYDRTTLPHRILSRIPVFMG